MQRRAAKVTLSQVSSSAALSHSRAFQFMSSAAKTFTTISSLKV